MESQRTITFPCRFVDRDGSIRQVIVRTRVLTRDSDDRGVVGTIAPATVGTGSQAFVDALLEGTPDLVAVIDSGGKLLFVSSSSARVLGRDAAYWTGRTVFDLVHPSDVSLAVEAMAGTLEEGAGVKIPLVLRLQHADGEWRDFEVIANNLVENPEIGGLLINARDLTERRAAEEGLAESRQRFAMVFEQAPIGMAILSAEGKFLRVNRALSKMLGLPATKLMFSSIFDYVVQEDLDVAFSTANRAIADGELAPTEVRYRRADG